jgi:hypothetical protein
MSWNDGEKWDVPVLNASQIVSVIFGLEELSGESSARLFTRLYMSEVVCVDEQGDH